MFRCSSLITWFVLIALLGSVLVLPRVAEGAIHDPNNYNSLGTLNPSSNVNVDTSGSSPSMSSGATFTGVVDNGVAIFAFATVDVPSGVTFNVSGNRPLAILSQGDFDFDGTIDVSASGSSAGPGGSGGATFGGSGFGTGGGSGDTGGAGGAGFGGFGGTSGGATPGGMSYGDLSVTLEGGSGGGMTTFSSGGGEGGGGGGAVELGAFGDLDFDGTIDASGADGVSFTGFDGGGGGSGGGIVLHSTHNDVNMSGTLNAQGGNGGSATDFGGGGGAGGRIYLQGVNVSNTGNHNVSGGSGGTGGIGTSPAPAGGSGNYTENTIVPPNNPPTIDSFAISLNENASYTFDRAADFEDPNQGNFDDPDGGQLEEVRVVSLPGNGLLEFQGNAISSSQLPFDIDRDEIDDLVYVPDPYYNGPDEFDYNASDGIDFAVDDETIDIDVIPYNNAPVLDNSGNPYLNSAFTGITSPRGTSVSTLLSRGAGGDPISDPDTIDPRGIALIWVDESHGDWEFTLDDGNSWSPVSNVSESNALLLDDSNDVQLRFNTSSFAGTLNPAIEFRAWDQYEGSNGSYYDIPGNGGTGTSTTGPDNAFSNATETAFIEVQEPPEIRISRDGATVDDGTTDSLSSTVPPQSRQRLTYTVHNDGAGTLTLTGTPRVEVPATSNANVHLIVVPDERVDPGNETRFTLHLTPQSNGSFSADVIVPNDDPAVGDYVFTLEGTAADMPHLVLEHDGSRLAHNTQHDIGHASTESARTLAFTVRNDGSDDLADLDVALTNQVNVIGAISQNVGQTSLGPGEQTSFEVELRPLSSDIFTLELTVSSDDPTHPQFVAPITGEGVSVEAGRLTIERLPGIALPKPEAHDPLGYLLENETSEISWQLHNTGFEPLTDIEVTLAGPSNVTASVTNAPDATLDGRDSSTFTLQLEPDPGTFEVTIIVESSDPWHPSQEVRVSGEGTNDLEPSLVMVVSEPEPVEHGETATLPGYQEEMTSAYPFLLVNRGTDDLTVTLPVQLAALENCAADILEQPGSGSTVQVEPQGWALLRVAVEPLSVPEQASFELHVTSDDPEHPTFYITAWIAGPVGMEVGGLSSGSRGCATLPHGPLGSGSTLQALLALLAILALAVLRRRAQAAFVTCRR